MKFRIQEHTYADGTVKYAVQRLHNGGYWQTDAPLRGTLEKAEEVVKKAMEIINSTTVVKSTVVREYE